MSEELFDLFENAKHLKRSDVKQTEKKLETDIIELIDNKEYAFLKPYLKNNGRPLYQLIMAYIKKIGGSKAKTDANLTMLAPIIASMESILKQ